MAKSKPLCEITSYGIYQHWDAEDKQLPKIREFTTSIPAQLSIEFGLIINLKRAKNRKIKYCIYHPDIPDDNGGVLPPFVGEEFVRSNDWEFYLGDTLWEPIENKTGDWRMVITLDDTSIADKTFTVEEDEPYEGARFWRRGKSSLFR